MSPKKRIFLVDFDNTLLNTDKLKEQIDSEFSKQFGKFLSVSEFWKEYEKVIKSDGFNNVPKLAKNIAKKINLKKVEDIENLFYKANFTKCIIPDSMQMLNNLKKVGKVVIYSLGHPIYQAIKIRGSGIEKIVNRKNVIIVQNKKTGLQVLINKLNSSYSGVTIIDDRAEVLEQAKKIDSKIITVWFRYGKYKNTLPKNSDSINFETNIIADINTYLKSFVNNIESLSIAKNITNNQVNQLIKFTKIDNEIQKYTHDKERFKNQKTYAAWLKNKKVIYSLIDRENNLLGIIWFSKKKTPEAKGCDFTFAIRIYPPARGLGFSRKFIKIVLADFKHKNLWLSTLKNNKKAIKIYQSMGFKEIASKENEVLMILQNSKG